MSPSALCCGRFTAPETCALLADLGFRDTEPFAEVTGGDLLGLSCPELVAEFGVSHFQVCPLAVGLAHCLVQGVWAQAHSPVLTPALPSQAKKVAMVQQAHVLFNSITASPGRAEVTVAELRVRTACLQAKRMPCPAAWRLARVVARMLALIGCAPLPMESSL